MSRSNYPNMSYCMMSNTKLALEQVLADVEGAMDSETEAEYMNKLRQEERRAFSDMYEMCQRFADMYENMEQAQAAAALDDAADAGELDDEG